MANLKYYQRKLDQAEENIRYYIVVGELPETDTRIVCQQQKIERYRWAMEEIKAGRNPASPRGPRHEPAVRNITLAEVRAAITASLTQEQRRQILGIAKADGR